MIRPLGDLASVRSGYPFRTSIEAVPDGNVAVVQGRDVQSDSLHFTPSGSLDRISSDGFRRISDHLLHPGDILIMARGPRNYAAVFEAPAESSGPTIAVGSFHVISPHPEKIHPHFLAWFLSQDSAQAHFRASNTGTSIPMISLDAVRTLPVSLPPLAIQQQVVSLTNLFEKERRLSDQIAALQRQWLSLWTRQQSA
jgi:hypothetical protein